jgi:hypothetical protein
MQTDSSKGLSALSPQGVTHPPGHDDALLSCVRWRSTTAALAHELRFEGLALAAESVAPSVEFYGQLVAERG